MARAVWAALAAACLASGASAQLRVVTWNISNYSGADRQAAIRTAVYGAFNGRSMSPDVICAQEFLTPSALTAFVTALNGASGSPGDWAAAPFIDGPDTQSVMVYRTTKVQFLQAVTVALGSTATDNQPRNTYRYDFHPDGYTPLPANCLGVYNVHMKSGSSGEDIARRLVESRRIRDNAEGVNTNGPGTALPAGYRFMVAGDMNMQTSSQTAYQEFVASMANNTGRFFDPIATPGSWNNNMSFRFVHTQDPVGAGGMDDRHDQMLVSATLIDGAGLDYIGDATNPYSTSTWNDPDHSYRVWGNDGSGFDQQLTVAGNTMVGATIAQALRDVCTAGGGHLPVFLDLRVPARVFSTPALDFGTVEQGSTPPQLPLAVLNDGDVALWTVNGIANLSYTLAASSGFTAPGGTFVDAPGGTVNTHTITMSTAAPGVLNGTVTITSNSTDQPVRVVPVTGTVVAPPTCEADFNGDGNVDQDDVACLIDTIAGNPGCSTLDPDFDQDGNVDQLDVAALINVVAGGPCP